MASRWLSYLPCTSCQQPSQPVAGRRRTAIAPAPPTQSQHPPGTLVLVAEDVVRGLDLLEPLVSFLQPVLVFVCAAPGGQHRPRPRSQQRGTGRGADLGATAARSGGTRCGRRRRRRPGRPPARRSGTASGRPRPGTRLRDAGRDRDRLLGTGSHWRDAVPRAGVSGRRGGERRRAPALTRHTAPRATLLGSGCPPPPSRVPLSA